MLVQASFELPPPAIGFAIYEACSSFPDSNIDPSEPRESGVILVDDSNEKLFTTTASECRRKGVPLLRCQTKDQLQRMLTSTHPESIWLAGESSWIEQTLLLCAQKITEGLFVVLLLDRGQEVVLQFPWATKVPFRVVGKPTRPKEINALLEHTVIAQQHRRNAERYLTCFCEVFDSFLPCEKEILHAICNGKMNKQIATQMNVSIRTIEKKRQQIFRRLDVCSAGSLGYRVGLAEAFQKMTGPSWRSQGSKAG